MSREQDKRLAELLGWKQEGHVSPVWVSPEGRRLSESNVPDYSTDIAACFAMEAELEHRRLADRYADKLQDIIMEAHGEMWSSYQLIHATPEQRVAAAIAALETV